MLIRAIENLASEIAIDCGLVVALLVFDANNRSQCQLTFSLSDDNNVIYGG